MPAQHAPLTNKKHQFNGNVGIQNVSELLSTTW